MGSRRVTELLQIGETPALPVFFFFQERDYPQ